MITEDNIFEIQDELDLIFKNFCEFQKKVQEYRNLAESGSDEKQYLRRLSNKLTAIYGQFENALHVEYYETV